MLSFIRLGVNAFNPIIVSGIFTHKTPFFCLMKHSIVQSVWTFQFHSEIARPTLGGTANVRKINIFSFTSPSSSRSASSCAGFIYGPFGLSVHSKVHEGISARRFTTPTTYEKRILIFQRRMRRFRTSTVYIALPPSWLINRACATVSVWVEREKPRPFQFGEEKSSFEWEFLASLFQYSSRVWFYRARGFANCFEVRQEGARDKLCGISRSSDSVNELKLININSDILNYSSSALSFSSISRQWHKLCRVCCQSTRRKLIVICVIIIISERRREILINFTTTQAAAARKHETLLRARSRIIKQFRSLLFLGECCKHRITRNDNFQLNNLIKCAGCKF